jgi:hypothetical protein
MLVLATRLMSTFGVPKILFSVETEDTAVVRNKVRSIEKLEIAICILEYIASRRCILRCCCVPFDNGSRNDTDLKFSCQFAVPIEVFLVLRRLSYVNRILGDIAVQMIPVAVLGKGIQQGAQIPHSGKTTSCACRLAAWSINSQALLKLSDMSSG